MKNYFKRTAMAVVFVLAINCFTAVTFAQETKYNLKSDENETPYSSDNEFPQEKQYSDYDLAISNLLKMGWSMSEINDLPESEILKYSNVISFETAENYLCTYIDEENEEKIVSVPKDVYDHIINKENIDKDNADSELSNMSSNGKLSISPIWSSEYYDSYAFDGKMSQRANLTWMGNNTYFTNYRCEWTENPNVMWKDIMYIYNGGMNAKMDTSYFVYKYERPFYSSNTQILEYSATTETNGKIKRYPYNTGIGFVFQLFNPGHVYENGSQQDYTHSHRMYMSYDLDIWAGRNSVVTCAGYYHSTSVLSNPSITNITSSGAVLTNSNFLTLGNPTLYLNATNN